MTNVSRPLVALLIATVAFFALWIVALKPGGASSPASDGTSKQALGAFSNDINAAHRAVGIANHAAAAAGGETPATHGPAAQGSGATASRHTSATAAHRAGAAATTTHRTTATAAHRTATHRTATSSSATRSATHASGRAAGRSAPVTASSAPKTAASRLNVVTRAIEEGRVVAILFYNPGAADDVAVAHELASIPTHRGKVVKVAVPIAELANYPVITDQVPINEAPTLVLVDRARQATTLVGFASGFEIAQRVLDALAGSA